MSKNQSQRKWGREGEGPNAKHLPQARTRYERVKQAKGNRVIQPLSTLTGSANKVSENKEERSDDAGSPSSHVRIRCKANGIYSNLIFTLYEHNGPKGPFTIKAHRVFPDGLGVLLVRAKGLEPPWSFPHMDLNHTRLPVPPRPHLIHIDN